MTQPRPNGQVRSNATAFATTFRLLLALAHLEVAPETYCRLADAVPIVGRDALRHIDLMRHAPRWACWASRLRYAYTRVGLLRHGFGTSVKQWFLCSVSYRENDLPHIELGDGTKLWYCNGHLLHRDDDKPAVVRDNGRKEWWRHGKRHRDNDRPAVVRADGTKEWWFNGLRHRGGMKPAVKYANGMMEWWDEGNVRDGRWLRDAWRSGVFRPDGDGDDET